MERRKALAVASAATLILGGAVVGTASVSGASFLGFGGSKHGPGSFAASVVTDKQGVIIRKRDVYDKYVVDTGDTTAPSSSGGSGGGSSNSNSSSAAGDNSTTNTWPTDPTTPLTDPKTGDTVTPTTKAATPHNSGGGNTNSGGGDTDSTTTVPTQVTDTTVPQTFPTTTPTTVPPTTTPTTTFRVEYDIPRNWPKGTATPPKPNPPQCHQYNLIWNGTDTSTAQWVCDT